jgi:hypothetical protein
MRATSASDPSGGAPGTGRPSAPVRGDVTVEHGETGAHRTLGLDMGKGSERYSCPMSHPGP